MSLSFLFFGTCFHGIFGIRRLGGTQNPTMDDYVVGHTDQLLDEFGVEHVNEQEISFELDPESIPTGYLVKYDPNYKYDPNFSEFNWQEIPEVIAQYGPARTATTLQFHSLCALMVLLYTSQVDCKFGQAEVHTWFTHAEGQRFKVIKTHSINDIHQASKMGRKFWFFVTSKEVKSTEQIAQSMSVKPEYVQSFPLVKTQGYEITANYAPIFNLEVQQKDEFLNYMKLWSLLRQCCGSQQSKYHFRVLWGETPSSSCPVCDGQNLDVPESEIVSTKIFRQMRANKIVQDWAQPDPHFTGTYCTWYNHQVACKPLGFNQLPKEPYC